MYNVLLKSMQCAVGREYKIVGSRKREYAKKAIGKSRGDIMRNRGKQKSV